MDPFTIASLIGSGIGFISQQRGLKEQMRRENQLMANAGRDEAAALKNLKNTQFSVSPAYRQALMMSQQDPMADMQRQQNAAREAANVSALKSGGARALIGGLGGVAQQSANQAQAIEADSYDRRMRGLQTYGAQEQAVRDKNISNLQGLYGQQYGRALQQKDQAMQNAFNIEDQKRSNFTNLLTQAPGVIQQGFGIDQGFFQDLFNPQQ